MSWNGPRLQLGAFPGGFLGFFFLSFFDASTFADDAPSPPLALPWAWYLAAIISLSASRCCASAAA